MPLLHRRAGLAQHESDGLGVIGGASVIGLHAENGLDESVDGLEQFDPLVYTDADVGDLQSLVEARDVVAAFARVARDELPELQRTWHRLAYYSTALTIPHRDVVKVVEPWPRVFAAALHHRRCDERRLTRRRQYTCAKLVERGGSGNLPWARRRGGVDVDVEGGHAGERPAPARIVNPLPK